MKKLVLSALLLLLPWQALAAAPLHIGLSNVVAALEGPFKADAAPGQAVTDFSADFFQESRIASLDKVQRGSGQVTIKFGHTFQDRAPLALFRWEYRQPTTQEIVSDGRTMWVYLPENRQVIQTNIGEVAQARAADPVTFLTGLGNLSRDFSITWAEPNRDEGGNYVLELSPRRSSPLIRRLLIVVDREAVLAQVGQGGGVAHFPILSTTVDDPNDNRTIIEFRDIRTNRGVSEAFFRFIMPPGVEVVRPTGSEMGF